MSDLSGYNNRFFYEGISNQISYIYKIVAESSGFMLNQTPDTLPLIASKELTGRFFVCKFVKYKSINKHFILLHSVAVHEACSLGSLVLKQTPKKLNYMENTEL